MKSKFYFGILLFALFIAVCSHSNAQSPDWLWAKSFGGSPYGIPSTIAVGPAESGDVYTIGPLYETVDFDPGAGSYYLSPDGFSANFISKLDGAGNFLWAKKMDGSGGCELKSIAVDPGTGSVYIAGFFAGSYDFDPGPDTVDLSSTVTGYGNMFISKLDGQGNFVWAKAVDGAGLSYGSSIALGLAGSGDVYITGAFEGTVDFDPGPDTFNLTSTGDIDISLLKLDSSGNFVWAKTMGGPSPDDYVLAMCVDPEKEDIYTTGSFEGSVDFDPGPDTFNLTSPGAGASTFISKTAGSGNFVWAKAISGEFSDLSVSSIAVDQGSGSVYTAGHFKGTADFDPNNGIFNLTQDSCEVPDYFTYLVDTYISKLDGSGNFVWAKAIGGRCFSVHSPSIAVDHKSGDIYISGVFFGTVDFNPGTNAFPLTSVSGGCPIRPPCGDPYISKLDESGNFIWAKAMGGTDGLGGSNNVKIVLNSSGHVYMTGEFFSSTISFDSITLASESQDIFIAKLDTAFTTSVFEIEEHQVNIYPNPATNELTIKVDEGEFLTVGITMFNILGEFVFSIPKESIAHQQTIDISRLQTGIYFIELNIDGERVMKKVVKEN